MEITTPCAVCAVQARVRHSAFWASRGLGWAVIRVAGRIVHRACAHDAGHAERSMSDGSLVIEGGIAR